jgi:alkylation response protein AidB-like acyl-CoA dehydrogenase
MTHEVFDRIEELASFFEAQAEACEELGRLPDETAQAMRAAGVIRMLQPLDHGGYESHPCDFFETVMAIAARCGSSGWIAGIVGVHPFEMALADPQVQKEIWGEDPDTWIASPYVPIGRATPVDGGYRFSGRWPFSSGTDHCKWIFLGGLEVDDDGQPVDPDHGFHFILPRSDYEIVHDSWNVVGLRGTGSKDVIVRDAFVPSYRVVDANLLLDGSLARDSGRDSSPLYRMPWSAIFPPAITCAVIGAAEGALAAHLAYQKQRVSPLRGSPLADPFSLSAIGEAASEIHSCRTQLLTDISMMYDLAEQRKDIPMELRARGRRDQVRASWRATRAVDDLFAMSGGNALRMDKPFQRFWRDTHAGLNHGINSFPGVYGAYANAAMGLDIPGLYKLRL